MKISSITTQRFFNAADSFLIRKATRYLQTQGRFVSRYQPGEKERKIVLEALLSQYGTNVLSGPFQGMAIDTASISWGDGGMVVRLLGCVEQELWTPFEEFFAKEPRQIVNVGCAEGFYSIGAALRLPKADILAIDISPNALLATQKNALLNDVSARVKTFGALEEALPHVNQNALWIVDIEGAEYDLILPSNLSYFSSSDFIIELHRPYTGRVFEKFISQFDETHDIEIISSSGRNPNYYDVLKELPDSIKWPVIAEGRSYAQKWLIARTNSRATHKKL